MTDLINTVLGDYKVEAFIGEGPNGRVFRAAGLTLRVPVALKVFDSRFTSDPEIKARLLMYGQEVGALSHAHIATVHHTHSSSTHTFVVSELVDGPNLAQFRPSTAAREWVPSWWGVVNCVRQAAEAVAAAHEAGVAHGNLKLTDVLLSGPDPATAAVKVTDFGLDRLLAGTEPDAEAERRKDVHSLGRMLYELTTGRTMPDEPPSSMTEGATLPREIVAGYPDSLEAVLMRCLGGASIATAGEVASALRSAFDAAAASSLPVVRGATLPAVQEAASVGIAVVQPPPSVMVATLRPPLPPKSTPGPLPTLYIFDRNATLFQTVQVRTARLTFGSADGNDVLLPSDAVAAHHVQIDFDESHVMVCDLGGTNGTWQVAKRPVGSDYDREPLLPQVRCGWGQRVWLQVGACWLWLEPPKADVLPPVIEITLDPTSRRLAFTPGQPQACHLTLLNQTTQIDRVMLSLEGMRPEWVEGTGKEIKIQANARKEVTLTITVPRSSSAKAGEYPVTIKVHSQANRDAEHGVAEAVWTVQPFDAMTAWIVPKKTGGFRRAKYTLTLQNDGNRATKYSVSGADEEKQFEFLLSDKSISQVAQLPVQVPPGEKVAIKIALAAPTRWFGNPTSHSFVAEASADDDSPRQSTEAQFNHRALLPIWALVLIPVVFVGILMFGSRYFQPKVLTVGVSPRNPLPNEPVIITWQTRYATNINVLQDASAVDPPPASGTTSYRFPNGFEKDTQIQVRGDNLFGIASNGVTVTLKKAGVVKAKLPTVLHFTVDPEQVIVGQTATLSWEVTDAERVEVDGVSVRSTDRRLVYPTADREYTLTAYNVDNLSTQSKVPVKVSKGIFVPTDMKLELTNPRPRTDGKQLSVGIGTIVTLKYEAKNATMLRINSVPPKTLMDRSGSVLAEIRGEGLYEFSLVATDELNREYRTDAIRIQADCKWTRFLKGKIPCDKTPRVEWK